MVASYISQAADSFDKEAGCTSFSTMGTLSMSLSGLPSKFVNANMLVCIILGKVGPGESISWMDATLQEMKVFGQCGVVPRSYAFQREALCEVYHSIAQINIY